MATEIQKQMVEVQDAIIKQKYFVELYLLSLAKYNMSTASIDQHEHTDQQIVNLANEFWMQLPDDPSIRRYPFVNVCNIAEHIFDGPDDE